MTKRLLTTLLIIPTLLIAEPQLATITAIEDGDTVIVDGLQQNGLRLQLLGIDAPEDSNNAKLLSDSKRMGVATTDLIPLGSSATAHLKTLLKLGDQVSVEADPSGIDRYGRLPASVFRHGDTLSLNEMMVRDGYAILLTKPPLEVIHKPFAKRLQQLQNEAVAAPRGLWQTQPQLTKAWAELTP
ncbi:MAG: thermonuclease family protein [Gammaproteobacteria bacterium]|nr:thermonuclease family protein [Gammaproteobacteria bacterium]